MEFNQYPSYEITNRFSDGVVVSGYRGVLHSVSIGSSGAASASGLIIYDGMTAAGKVLFKAPTMAGVTVNNLIGNYVLDASFNDGIYVDVTGTTDVTVTYIKKQK